MMSPVVRGKPRILYRGQKGPEPAGYAARDARDIAWLPKYNPAEIVRPIGFYGRSKRGRGAVGPMTFSFHRRLMR